MKLTSLFLFALIGLMGCTSIPCPDLSGVYMRDPYNVVDFTSAAGQLLVSQGGVEQACNCDDSKVEFNMDDRQVQVQPLKDGLISINGWEYSRQLPTCLGLMGKYSCSQGNECAIGWSTGTYYLDYFGNVFPCDCEEGELIIAGATKYKGQVIATVDDPSISFNDYRYFKHFTPQD